MAPRKPPTDKPKKAAAKKAAPRKRATPTPPPDAAIVQLFPGGDRPRPTPTAPTTGTPANPPPPKRTGRRSGLTIDPEVADNIAASVRAGAFDYLAAQAAGIAPATFREWMARGEGRDPDRPSTPEFAAFAAQISRAKAEARIVAEQRVALDDPFKWLRYGPGRDRGPDAPGWTDKVELDMTGTMGPTEVVVKFVNDWRAGSDPDA